MKKVTFKILTGVTLAAALATGSVVAMAASGDDATPRHGKWGHGERFDMMDTDKDGALSKAELSARGDAMFAKMDIDGDGVVTKEEATKAAEARQAERVAKRAEKRFSRLDADGDGKVTKAEFDAMGEKRFAMMDENGDGKIEKGEGRKMMKHHRGPGDDEMAPPPAPEDDEAQ